MTQQLKKQTQIFNVSSKNASLNGAFNSLVSVKLPNLQFNNSNIQNVYISVAHCEIPNSFYIVNTYNNKMVLNGAGYTIPVGNYNALSLITQLLSQLPSGFNITYSSVTNKYTFTYSTNFTINANHSQSTINAVIGLGTLAISSSSNSLTLPYPVNFLPLPRINFKTNFFKVNQTDIFLSLQNNATQNGIIYYNNPSQQKYLIEDKSINVFNISVCDENDNLINFNNIPWYLTFQIEIEYLGNNNIYNSNFKQFL